MMRERVKAYLLVKSQNIQTIKIWDVIFNKKSPYYVVMLFVNNTQHITKNY